MVIATPRRGDVYLVNLDQTFGREIRKTRPYVVLSPDELNTTLTTVTVAPMTTGSHDYPFRIPCQFQKKNGHVVLDQLRTVDHGRLVKRLGALSWKTQVRALAALQAMFAF